MTFVEKLNAIKNAGGGYRRISTLKAYWDDPDIQWFFYQGLSPFVHFSITLTSKDLSLGGPLEDPRAELIELLDSIATGQLKGTQAKRKLKSELSGYTHDMQRYITAMVNKTLRIGVGPGTIEKIAPGFLPKFSVPLAHPVDWAKVDYPCIVSPKIDGLRCVYEDGVLYSRNGKELQGLDWLKSRLAYAVRDTEIKRLDGEIIAPGQHFDEISGKLRSFNENKDAHYYIFDIVVDATVPLYTRMAAMAMWATRNRASGFSVLNNVTCFTQEEVFRQYDKALASGFEGVMVKGYSSCYFDGRSYDWQKVKKHDTLDLPVIGIEDGEGRLEGLVGALVCQLPNGKTTKVGTGLSDAQRRLWMQGPSNIIGKTVEVEFMEYSSKGVLRHPRLKCVRGDK